MSSNDSMAITRSMRTTLHSLASVLPLSTPYTLWVDPCNLCNFRCIFCPTGHDKLISERPKGKMELTLYRKILDDLSIFPNRLKRLCLWKDGEPLLHTELSTMVTLAKEANIADRVELSTNGVLLTRQKSHALVDARLDRIQISVEHVHNEGYRSVTGNFSNYNQIRTNVAALWEERQRIGVLTPFIQVKMANSGLTLQEKDKFISDFEEIVDEVEIIDLSGWSASDAFDFTLGMQPERGYSQANLKKDRIVCPFPFYALAVNFDGSVSTCCVDWAWHTVVGSVRQESLQSIWNGLRLQALRMAHLEDRRNFCAACGSCQYMQGVAPENDLDDARSQLALIYQQPLAP